MWTQDACLLTSSSGPEEGQHPGHAALALPESSNRTSSFLMLSLYPLDSLATTLIADEKHYVRAKHYIPSLTNTLKWNVGPLRIVSYSSELMFEIGLFARGLVGLGCRSSQLPCRRTIRLSLH